MSASATAATVAPSTLEKKIANSGSAIDLGEGEEREGGERLPEPDRAAVRGREHEPVEHALLAFRDERARETEQRGEDDRHPQKPEAGELAGSRRQREVEDHERRATKSSIAGSVSRARTSSSRSLRASAATSQT